MPSNHKTLSNQSTKGNCQFMSYYCCKTCAENVKYNVKQQIWNTIVKSIHKICMYILSTNIFLSHYFLPFSNRLHHKSTEQFYSCICDLPRIHKYT